MITLKIQQMLSTITAMALLQNAQNLKLQKNETERIHFKRKSKALTDWLIRLKTERTWKQKQTRMTILNSFTSRKSKLINTEIWQFQEVTYHDYSSKTVQFRCIITIQKWIPHQQLCQIFNMKYGTQMHHTVGLISHLILESKKNFHSGLTRQKHLRIFYLTKKTDWRQYLKQNCSVITSTSIYC